VGSRSFNHSVGLSVRSLGGTGSKERSVGGPAAVLCNMLLATITATVDVANRAIGMLQLHEPHCSMPMSVKSDLGAVVASADERA
jgi:hypothetical protein